MDRGWGGITLTSAASPGSTPAAGSPPACPSRVRGRRDHLRDRGAARRPRGRPGRRHPARVEYVFGDTVTDLRQDDDGVDVTFEHAPPRRFGLVIGADGLYSPIRRLAFGADACLHPLGCAMARLSAPPTDLDGGTSCTTRRAAGWRLCAPAARRRRPRPGWACGWTRAPRCPATSTASGRCSAAPSRAWAGRRRCCRRHGHGERLRVHGRRAGAPATVVARPGGARRRCGRLPDAADRPRHERRAGAGLRRSQASWPGRAATTGSRSTATRPSLVPTSRPRSNYRPAGSTATPRAAPSPSGCGRRRCGR